MQAWRASAACKLPVFSREPAVILSALVITPCQENADVDHPPHPHQDRPVRERATEARAARAIPPRLFCGRQVHLRANIRKSRSRQARREDRLSILLMGLYMEMVQQAVEDRSQYEAGCNDNQKTREDRVGSRKDFSSRRFELTHWPHAGQNHRRIYVCVCKRHVLERAVASHSA